MSYFARMDSEEFYDLVFQKSKSLDSVHAVKTALSTFNKFCSEKYNLDRDSMISEIKGSSDGIRLFQNFLKWMLQDQELSIGTARNYISSVRRWLKLVGGIKIDSDDFRDYVIFPSDINDEEEAEPLTHEELRLILHSFSDFKRKALFMFMKSTGGRILECLRIQRKFIDFNTRPVTVKFPRSITKGKGRQRIQFIDSETVELLQALEVPGAEPENFIFRKNTGTDREERNNIVHAWNRHVTKIGLAMTYENGRLKKNIHSIRAFCMTQYEKATGDQRLAHAYGGHRTYLDQYLRRSDSEKAELFLKTEPYLALFTIILPGDQK